MHISPDIPKLLIGDITRIQQVLINLAGNALKFTQAGSVTIDATHLASAQPGQCRVLFTVSDTGIGIPHEKIDTLTDAFAQVDSSYTRQYHFCRIPLLARGRLHCRPKAHTIGRRKSGLFSK